MRKIILFLFSLVTWCVSAQQEAPHVRRGNRDYKASNFTEAEVDYRRGIVANDSSFESHYNLGNALFRQEKYADAANEYGRATELVQKAAKTVMDVPEQDRLRLSQAYHNLGNALYAQKNYGEAVKAFSNSLRLNPKDNDTRYNLVKAQQMQQQQQQQSQPQQESQPEPQPQEQEQPQNPMDQQTAEQILQALEQDEQNTQGKTRTVQGQKHRVEKDW